MRCYKITAGSKVRYAGTQADARERRNMLAEQQGVKDAKFEQVEIPLAKAELLDFLNSELEQAEERTEDALREANDTMGEDQ